MTPEKKTDVDKFRALPLWVWNDKLEKAKLLEQIDWLYKSGLGGFIIHARAGLKTEYLSEEWMDCVKACINHASELGMQAWIYDDFGWPSGFAGTKLLDDIENHDKYLTYTVGDYDKNALVSYLDTGDRLVRSDGQREGKYVNVFEHYSTSTVDILNPEVTDKFIKLTHNAYKNSCGESFKNVSGFFTDEPQYYRWDTPYTVMLGKHFKEKYNEDIFDNLGLLFFKREGFREFRYKYWSGLQELMLNNYSKRVYDWCSENGVELTGHYIEETALQSQMMCCGGIMPFYEYEHVPGIDWLGRYCDTQFTARQMSSVAEQLGRERTLAEIYAAAGWDATPRELKNLAELLYLGGVRITCHHFSPYSNRGERAYDYPAHYSPNNPWAKHAFKEFNDYFATLSAILSESKEQVKVAILQPVKSTYFYYSKKYDSPEDDIPARINAEFYSTVVKLEERNISYHFIDETLLAKYGSVDNMSLKCGKRSYDCIIIPAGTETMEESTERLLRDYVKAGGKIIVDGEKPKYVTWKPFSYDYLVSNSDYDALEQDSGCICRYNGGHLFISPREGKNGPLIFAVNHSMSESCEVKFDFFGKYTSFKKSAVGSDMVNTVPLEFTLRPNESAILVPSNDPVDTEIQFEIVTPDSEYTVLEAEQNSLTIDNPQYSTDGENYSPKMYVCRIFKELLDKRYKGDLYLKYNFSVKTVPESLRFKTGIINIEEVSVNGINVDFKEGESCDITRYLAAGENNITFKLNYWQRQQVYYVLYGDNITEGLKNCLDYDCELEPVVLEGDFGVYEKNGFTVGKASNIRIGENFVIDKKQDKIDGLVSGGYPFFAGRITLKQEIECKTDKVMLKLPFRWHKADVTLNGKYVGGMLMDDMLDISSAAKEGRNELVLCLTIGARNLYGPHHTIEQESAFTTPDSYNIDNPEHFRESSAFVEPLAGDVR